MVNKQKYDNRVNNDDFNKNTKNQAELGFKKDAGRSYKNGFS